MAKDLFHEGIQDPHGSNGVCVIGDGLITM